MIGKNFGPYRIESKLGEGGMGVVYRAMDTDLDRPVAIKTLLDESGGSGSSGSDSVARFMREAKAASRLQHPSIMTIYQFGVEEGIRYLVMEYIDGKTLKKMISGRPLSISEGVDIAIQVADGLAVAHEKGVVHRDLKPENVMVTSRGQVKILDFGLAKLHEGDKPLSDETEVNFYKTTVGTVLGTVSNMSPEQARGEVVDAKSDIFALGILMYEMGCGRNPFIAPTAQATMANILTKEPDLISDMNPAVSPDLERLIHLCLRKRASERPTANEAVSELKRIQTTLSARDLQAPDLSGGGYGSAAGFSTQPQTQQLPASGSKLQLDSGSRLASRAPSAPSARSSWTKSGVIPRIREIYYLIKLARIVVQWASLVIPFSFFFYMMVSGGLIRPQVVEGTSIFTFVKALVIPVLEFTEKVFTFRPVIEGWNLMLAGLGLVAFAVRHLLLLPFEQGEHWAKTQFIRSKAPAQRAGASGSADRGVSERLSLLREYSEAQRTLSQGKRHLAFLSIDIVGSTKMKMGEDQLVIEHAFAEWRKFIERILRTSNCWKVAFTPDGIMCAFMTARDAKRAGQTVLNELPWFNDGVHRLRTPFSVRCGIHVGEVIFPEDKPLEEVSDEVIDVAGHMQKYANQDSLWISREVLHELEDADKDGFFQVDRDVDNRITYEWRAYETQ